MGQRASATNLQPELTRNELEALEGLLKSSGFQGRHLEIGTAAGGTLCRMMACYPAEKRPPFMVIDPMAYFADQIQIVKRNLTQHELDPESVRFEIGGSAEIWERLKEENLEFDFIFVDGAHKIRYVIRDLRWADRLKVGGVICFHDHTKLFPDVTMPVQRWLRRQFDAYEVLWQADSLLAVKKKAKASPAVRMIDLAWATAWAPLLQWKRSLAKRVAR